MTVRGLWGGEKHAKCERLSFTINGGMGDQKIEHALAVSHLDLPCQTLYKEITQQIEREVSITVEHYKNAKPLILVGQDNWHLMQAHESQRILGSGLVISRTLLGWAVHGYCENAQKEVHSLGVHATCCVADFVAESAYQNQKLQELDDLIRDHFLIENWGVSEISSKRVDVDRATKILRETTRKVGNKWETGLLWKKDVLPKLDTKATALKRLKSLERRQDRDPVFAQKYHAEMSRLIDNGYAVRVNENKSPPCIRYISHFGVTNPNKPGKVRLVFDAAERTNGISMNDLLDTGPDLLESLVGVLLRFRQYPYAVKADIKDMYLRINVIEPDRGAQRFLYRGADRNRPPEEYEMTCLIFGSKSSPCSALYVKNTNAERFARTRPQAARSIVKNSYMDDFLASGRDIKEMQQLVRDVNLINREANFDMHDWASNKPEIVDNVQNESKLEADKVATLCDVKSRILGLFWDRIDDFLRFNVGLNKININLATGEARPTKREVLSIVMSVYDPLGILAPFTLNAKIIIQNIWVSGVGWDVKIRSDEFAKFQIWLKNLQQMANCTIPRSFIPQGTDYVNSQLHIFCDASKKAFAAAAYLRATTRDGSVHVALVMGKTRVKSTKPLTIPRLELQGAVLATRLASTIAQELDIKITERMFWTDSMTVLHWIRSGPRTKQIYVATRLAEINASTRATEWSWVPTELNPADDATRESNKPMKSTDRWLVGPAFLKGQPRSWPKPRQLSEIDQREADNLESKKEFIGTPFIKPRSWQTSAKDNMTHWVKLILKSLSIRNFFYHCYKDRNIMTQTEANERRGDAKHRVKEAQNFWYRLIQAAYYSEELEALRKNQELHKGSKLIKLRPFIDEDGLLRARGRVVRVFDKDSKQVKQDVQAFKNTPIILNADHYATKLLIEHYHEMYYHANNETVVNELRQKYYIVGLRNRLRWLVRNCVTCRLQRAMPEYPPMADLPECRTAYGQWPFSHCGIDYFGPMDVKIGRRREKRWGVLFTCMSTRAVHLELAGSLEASSTIMALQRLAARRGFPHTVYSDNGTNFVKASKELRDAVIAQDVNRLEEFAAFHQFTWKFNPPGAPHMGGAWERLIRSVKVAMNHALNGESYSEEVLSTLLAEVEHMINSRPLTHVSTDPNDEEGLTPNHILLGRSSGHLKTVNYDKEIHSPRKTFESVQNLAQCFWKRWLREYLPTIIATKKWHKPTIPLRVGDIVLILDYQTPRNSWKRGRVTDVYKNKSDGIIRSAKIRVGKGFFVRPVHKLIKIIGTAE